MVRIKWAIADLAGSPPCSSVGRCFLGLPLFFCAVLRQARTEGMYRKIRGAAGPLWWCGGGQARNPADLLRKAAECQALVRCASLRVKRLTLRVTRGARNRG